MGETMRVLVTGGTGFLGKHVLNKLWKRGYDFIVPEMYDLRYSRRVAEMYERFYPETVINLAAVVGGINANISQPGKFFYDNLKMGMNVIEGARVYGVKKFVQMGSACEYPRDAAIPLVESDLWNGYPEGSNAAYGIAKRALLSMGQAYHQQYGMNIIHLLPTNMYGPGDNFEQGTSHVIPALIRRFSEAVKLGLESVTIWGSGQATRDFLYADDAAEGVVLAMERYNGVGPVNLGSGREVSIGELAQKIARLSGYEGKIIQDASKTDGQPRRVLDISKAKEFGWEANTLLEAGLSRTIEWYNVKLRSAH
jgi:GDP-L-fucose synthase